MSLVGIMATGHHLLNRGPLDPLLTSQVVATTHPSSQPAATTCRCAQGRYTIVGRQWTGAFLHGRRAATQALTGIRIAAASPRERTQTMTGISVTQTTWHMGATLTTMTVGAVEAVGAVTHQIGGKGSEGVGEKRDLGSRNRNL
jgi:hypothetical protein